MEANNERVRTRQGHAGELGTPTDDREDEEQPATERPVISGGANGREDSGHDLAALRMSAVAWTQERLLRTAKLTPLATSTTELTALVPPPQGSTH